MFHTFKRATVILGSVTLLALPLATFATQKTVRQVAAGAFHTCALVTPESGVGSEVYCWGSNDSGQLGVGDSAVRELASPARVNLPDPNIRSIAAGAFHTCAVTNGSGTFCWGSNGFGQVGDTSNVSRIYAPARVSVATGVAFVQIAAAGDHTCAIANDNRAYCWGSNAYGQLGTQDYSRRRAPAVVANVFAPSSIALGFNHSCVIENDVVKCWGRNDSGQLGVSALPDTVPTPAITFWNANGIVKSISGGTSHTCLVSSNAWVWCAGQNSAKQGGFVPDRPLSRDFMPASDSGLSVIQGAIAVSVGGVSSCALVQNGAVASARCWGYNQSGELGLPGRSSGQLAGDYVPLGADIMEIAVGQHHGCAISIAGVLHCWGLNRDGQVGAGYFHSSDYGIAPVIVIFPHDHPV